MRTALAVMVGAYLLASPALGAARGTAPGADVTALMEQLRALQAPPQPAFRVQSVAELKAVSRTLKPVVFPGIAQGAQPSASGTRPSAPVTQQSVPRAKQSVRVPQGGFIPRGRAPVAPTEDTAPGSGQAASATPSSTTSGGGAATSGQGAPGAPTAAATQDTAAAREAAALDAYTTGLGVRLAASALLHHGQRGSLQLNYVTLTALGLQAITGEAGIVPQHFPDADPSAPKPLEVVVATFSGLPSGQHTYMLTLGSTYRLAGDQVTLALSQHRPGAPPLELGQLGPSQLTENAAMRAIHALFTCTAGPDDRISVTVHVTTAEPGGVFSYLQLVLIS